MKAGSFLALCSSLILSALSPGSLLAQAEQPVVPPLSSRIAVSAGMGVSYADVPDIVGLVNGIVDYSSRVPQFRAGVEFFGEIVVPVSPSIALKLDYAYLLLSYNGLIGLNPADFTVHAHLPTLVVQYILLDGGLYTLKAGAGAGFHFGSLAAKYVTVDDIFTGSGPGFLLELEGNTALGEHLAADLGGTLRADWIGKLTDSHGEGPRLSTGDIARTLHFFSVGARLGFSYHF